jgi:hypothetical protein
MYKSKTEDNSETKEEDECDKGVNSCETANAETNAFAEIVMTVNTLAVNYYVWEYLDPTKTYYTYEKCNSVEAENN